MTEEIFHIPVLKQEVISSLAPQKNENFIDCTGGFGGHSQEILKAIGPKGRLLVIEWDPKVSQMLQEKFKDQSNVLVVNDSYVNLQEIIAKNNFPEPDGILLDIGISSWDIDASQKGFTFQKDEILDMRYNTLTGKSAKEIVNTYQEKDLADVIYQFGEERFSRRIAKGIIEYRKRKEIQTTLELVQIIKNSVPRFYKDYAKTFQAIRIEANQELANLQSVLPQAVAALKKDGRLCVISFHSLEDRIVKNYFRELAKEKKIELLTKKPIVPAREEIIANRRSKPSKLRAIKKI